MYPYPNPSILTRGIELLKGIKWGSILDGTSKTLNVINQAIPVVYQIKPIFGNLKTIMNIASNINETTSTEIEEKPSISNTNSQNNNPIFYID